MRLLTNLFAARAGRYGPNSAQVERFLQLVRALTPEQWEQVYDGGAATAAAYGSPDWREIQALHKVEYGEGGWVNSLDRAIRHANWLDSKAAMATLGAALALADCEVITAGQFAACYAPFVETIPVESLGPGKAPLVTKPPHTVHERFAIRVRMLEPHQWQEIVWIGQLVDEAIGTEAVNAAVDAVADAAQTAGVSVETLGAAFATIDGLPEADSVQSLRGVYEGVGRVFNKRRWATERVAQFDAEVDTYAAFAKGAVLALVARDLITPQQFAALYAPFAGLIPVRSLGTTEQR